MLFIDYIPYFHWNTYTFVLLSAYLQIIFNSIFFQRMYVWILGPPMTATSLPLSEAILEHEHLNGFFLLLTFLNSALSASGTKAQSPSTVIQLYPWFSIGGTTLAICSLAPLQPPPGTRIRCKWGHFQ